MYANSLIGVGVASSMYHSSKGKLRKFLRWVDYTMIATATVVSNIFIDRYKTISIGYLIACKCLTIYAIIWAWKHKAFINIVFTMLLACATTVDVLGSG